jgi:molybdopterin synthase catalytic subunit
MSTPVDHTEPAPLFEEGIHVQLTYTTLDIAALVKFVKSPEAGAIVTFIGESYGILILHLSDYHTGTTRNNFQSRSVVHLSYSSYAPLALRSMMNIARSIKQKHNLKGIAIVHKLGDVPVGEESIIIAVSSPHRLAAWRAGEEALENIKDRVEIWKYERFDDGGEWRANRDGIPGVEIL